MPDIRIKDDELWHYGIIRKSGRYPWGSGAKWGDAGTDTPTQRSRSFLDVVAELQSKGVSRKDIAEGFGMTTTQLRDVTTIARNAERRDNQLKAERLRAKGWSTSAIARELGKNESSVRELLNKSVQERTMILENTVNMLRDEVDRGGWIDVGKGNEYYIGNGISKEKLRAALSVLKDEGYEVIPVQVAQAANSNQKTTVNTLCPPGTKYKDVVTSLDQIRGLVPVSDDGGRSWTGMVPPLPISQDRLAINYKEDGGAKADGVIYVRPGVKDLELGGSSYAQVRIDIDGTHYLKGMAVYKKDLPDGVDLMFNTNKAKADLGSNKLAALKEQTGDPGNPFGAVINRQIKQRMPDGTEKATSAMNILQEEGAWDSWSRTLSAQVLSKQSPKLIESQLAKTYEKRKAEYDEISALTNPTVRKKLLESLADAADSDAVHLQAAGMPRSSYHVILPFNKLKDNEVYAPNMNHGEKVVLIRYPHGGKFEIPELTVNNNHPEAKATIGRAKDAVGINHKVAERMSGADFDGDFVMVIPNNNRAIKTAPALKSLENFDPRTFKLPDGVEPVSEKTKNRKMGDITNLITDMTIKDAKMDEIARATKHSMVVIDAAKHGLDIDKSAQVHGINALKTKYQNGPGSGASTLVSKSTSQQRVQARKLQSAKDGGPIDKATGKLVYTYDPDTRARKLISTKMFETDDAHSLSSGTLVEKVYGDHANRLKALANASRKKLVNDVDSVPMSPTAKRVYKDEVDQLKADLIVARKNSPRERTAQLLANAIISQKRAAQPDMDAAQLKKIKHQALAEARTRAGAKKTLVPISDKQWEAIQAGAVSKSMLKDILDNADIDRVKELATPKPDYKMDASNIARAKQLSARGLTQAEIARILGVGLTTLKKGLE